MNAVLKWAGIIGAVWLAVSILAAVFWAVAGRRIFRKPPERPPLRGFIDRDAVNNVVAEINRRNRQNGVV